MKQFDSSLLHDKLKEYFGFSSFKGNQEAVIRNVLEGKDTFVLMPTGGGKSLCYQLPAMLMDGVAIVISPLIALMKNQVDAMRTFSAESGIAHFLNSSLNKTAVAQVRQDVLDGKTKLLYFAPESLTKEDNVAFLRKIKVSFYAIDEAHCISEWGHDFRPEYRRIRPIINEIGSAPLIALTATATPKVQLDIQKNLGMSDASVFKSSFNRPNLYYEIRPKHNVDHDIIRFIKQNEGKSGIIYCLSRKKVEELTELLVANGIRARAYHAGMDAATRAANQDDFLMERVEVIVATIAFGMGIDKPDVRYVIHYDIPKSLEGYYQETGRAGRDGGEGYCLTFYSYKDIQKLEKFMQGKPIAEQEIGKLLLLETVSYAESSMCRRKTLLHYFGEDYTEDAIRARLAVPRAERQRLQPDKPPRKVKQYRVHAPMPPRKRVKGFHALYLYYVYLLRGKTPKRSRPVPFTIRQEAAKLRRYQRQFRFLRENRIETVQELSMLHDALQAQIDALTERRKGLYEWKRRGMDVTQELSAVNERLRQTRRSLNLCQSIETDIPRLQTQTQQYREQRAKKEAEKRKYKQQER